MCIRDSPIPMQSVTIKYRYHVIRHLRLRVSDPDSTSLIQQGSTIIHGVVDRQILAQVEVLFVIEPCCITGGAKQNRFAQKMFQVKLGGFSCTYGIEPIY